MALRRTLQLPFGEFRSRGFQKPSDTAGDFSKTPARSTSVKKERNAQKDCETPDRRENHRNSRISPMRLGKEVGCSKVQEESGEDAQRGGEESRGKAPDQGGGRSEARGGGVGDQPCFRAGIAGVPQQDRRVETVRKVVGDH